MRRFLYLFSSLFFLLLLPSSLLAQGVRHNEVARGSVTLSGSSGFSGAVERILSGASVTVCNGSTLPPAGSVCTSLASIYSDISLGAGFLISNPTTADTNGNYSFYANGGVPYVISVSFTGFTTYSYIWSAPFSTIINTQITTNNILPAVSGTYAVGSASSPYLSMAVGGASGQATTQNSAATASRTITWPDASGNPSLAIIEYCGATSGATQACSKTVQTLPIIVWGDVLLNTATSQSITTLPFTDALYSCTGSDLSTPAGVVSFNVYASASVTIIESGGNNTDHLRYMCIGH